MTSEDIPAGMKLVRAAGWNQTEADWGRFLNAASDGCFAAESEGLVCGTTASIIYDHQLAWIGMVLVSPDHRGRGIGTALLKKCLTYLDSQGPLTVKLDATPQGMPIYQQLGFDPEYEIERWEFSPPETGRCVRPCAPTGDELERRAPDAPGAAQEEGGELEIEDHMRNTAGSALDAILAVDQAVFGANRSELLLSLHHDAPELTATAWRRGTLAGYTLGRHGRYADQLGPWIGQDEEAAGEVFKSFLKHSARERLVVDCLKSNPLARSLLDTAGFKFCRPLTRMVRGSAHNVGRADPDYQQTLEARPPWPQGTFRAHKDHPGPLCAILGPEFG